MKKNLKKFVIIPIILFAIFSMVQLPTSHAKFIKTGNFLYNITLKSIQLNSNNNNVSVSLDNSSTSSDAIYNVRFKRNKIMYEDPDKIKSDTKDTYKITLKDNQNKCSIVKGSMQTPNGENSGDTAWYTTLNTDDTISFQAKCNVVDDPNVDNSKEFIYLDLKVEETIQNYQGNNDTTFTYFEHQTATKLSDYYTGDRDPNQKTLYKGAIQALKAKYGSEISNESIEIMIKYFNMAFVDRPTSEILNISDEEFRTKAKSIKEFGFIEQGDTCKYIVGLKFLGYAYTWHRDYYNTDKNHYQFAFSVENPVDREALFREYFAQYGSNKLQSNGGLEKLMNYINTYNGGINAAFNDWIAEIKPELIDGNQKYVILHFYDSILDIIDNRNTSADSVKIIDNTIKDQSYVWSSIFLSTLRTNPAVMADSAEIYWKIYDSFSGEIGKSVLTNVGKQTFTTFSDYFVVNGINKSVMINIYSDASNPNYTYFRVFDLTPGSQITLAYSSQSSGDLSKQINTINTMNKLTNAGAQDISGFGNPTSTTTDANGTVHSIYEAGGGTYDFYTTNGTSYITYTLP